MPNKSKSERQPSLKRLAAGITAQSRHPETAWNAGCSVDPSVLAAAIQKKQLVDEFGRLDAELTPLKAKLRRMEELGKIIRSWHANVDPELSVSSRGEQFEVVLSQAGMQTHINDLGEVYRSIGHEAFLKISSVTLKSLESAVDSAAYASLTRKERTGSRSIIVRSVCK